MNKFIFISLLLFIFAISANGLYSCKLPNGILGTCRSHKECPGQRHVPECGFVGPDHYVCCSNSTMKQRTDLNEEFDCQDGDNIQGSCTRVDQCKSVEDIFKGGNIKSNELRKYLISSQCGFDGKHPKICCTKDNPTKRSNRISQKKPVVAPIDVPRWLPKLKTLVPLPPVCGTVIEQKIFGGKETGIEEFPWSALLFYKVRQYSFLPKCGGSLISDQFVLSAAHCSLQVPKSWQISHVRLGEWKISTEVDCDPDNPENCMPSPSNINVNQVFIHPEYSEKSRDQHHDISLLKLAEKVKFSTYIQPICLPLEPSQWDMKNSNDLIYKVNGWGFTEDNQLSDVKLMVDLEHFDQNNCVDTYQKYKRNITKNQICAGGAEGIDTCSGDSGSGLSLVSYPEITAPYSYIIGIVSFGHNRCGTKDVPGVYTNVAAYLEWITDTISRNI